MLSESYQFWQYAREAMLSIGYANTDDDRQDLLELARIWTQAALALQATLQERPHGAG
jgi:hypothetical protein